ncbi:MAG: PAS domain-containing sensor histidine kinase [Chloroflexota bacterium]|nr:PAS domain-containing sensor histidine kinase [Chloroflexota bacterium]
MNDAISIAKARFFDLALGIQCLANFHGYFVAVNRPFMLLLGYDEGTLLRTPWMEFVHPDDRGVTHAAVQQMFNLKSLANFENRYRCSDGSYKWLRWSGYSGDDNLNYASAVDITAQKLLRDELTRTEQDLRERESWYRSLVESQLDMVCRHLPDTTLTFVNDAYCRYWNKSRADLIGQTFLRFVDETEADKVRINIVQIMTNPQPLVSEVQARDADGGVIWVQWLSHSITDENGQVVMIQAVGRDITQLKQLESEGLRARTLEIELDKQREISHLREGFMSLMTHEVRTPLSIILLLVDSLQQYYDRYSRENIMDKLDTVATQVHRMVDLMDGVLTLSRMDATNVKMHPVSLDLVAFCRTIINELRLTDMKRHPFTFQTDSTRLDATIDRRMLEYIIINLITNAIKYSLSTTCIDITLFREGAMFVFVCNDQGIGIPPNELPYIFDPFHRAVNVGVIEGTGLGLAIVKQSVERLGGTIQIQSQVGAGTRFTVQLPIHWENSVVKINV